MWEFTGGFSATPLTTIVATPSMIKLFPTAWSMLPKYLSASFSVSTIWSWVASALFGSPCISLKPKKSKKLGSAEMHVPSMYCSLSTVTLKPSRNSRHADAIDVSCLGNCAPRAGPDGACENDSLSLLNVLDTRKMRSASGWKLSNESSRCNQIPIIKQTPIPSVSPITFRKVYFLSRSKMRTAVIR